MIIYTVAVYFYIPYYIDCSYVLLLTTPFVYITGLYLYHFLPLFNFLAVGHSFFFLAKTFFAILFFYYQNKMMGTFN